MKNSKLYILQIAFLIGINISTINMAQMKSTDQDSQKEISCEEAVKNVHRIKVGMKESEIIDLIGVPKTKSNDKWEYDFLKCTGLSMPKPGMQKIFGGTISFKEKAVSEIRWAWIDAIGPGAVSPAQKRKMVKNKHNKGGNI